MTSALALNARISAALGGTYKPLYCNPRTGVPIEGQLPKSYSTFATGAQTLSDPFNQWFFLIDGTTLTCSAMVNFVGREITFKYNGGATGCTVHLPAGVFYNGSTNTTATFGGGVGTEGVLTIIVSDVAGVPLVSIKSLRNVVLSP